MDLEKILRDSHEVGKRVAAARGYALMQRPGFAKAMEIGVTTLRNIETGENGPSVRKRLALLEQAQRASGCPPEIVGLSGSASAPDLRAELATLHARIDDLEESLQERDDESVLPQDSTSGERSSGQGREAANQ